MTQDHSPRRPRELDAALDSRNDREALAAVWDAIPGPGTDSRDLPTAAERHTAWTRLRATLVDDTRAPFASDVAPAVALLGDGDREVSIDRAPLPVRAGAAHGWTARRWLLAASVIGTLSAGIGIVRSVPVTYTGAVVSPMGAPVAALRLADGSSVWLSPGSRMAVNRALAWPGWLRASSRDIQLTGSAFFSVQRDGRAFTVRTTDASVRVLGTRFEVRSPVPAFGTQVTVEEGRVSVTPAGASRGSAGEVAQLGAGQRTVVGAGVALVANVPPARIASWRLGGLAALDEPLGAVLGELARRYQVTITHAADVDARATVSIFYPTAPAVDAVLADLCTAHGLMFQRTSRGYHVLRRNVAR